MPLDDHRVHRSASNGRHPQRLRAAAGDRAVCWAGSPATSRLTAADLLPYVLTFAALWIAGQVCWRVAVILITRVEIYGLEALYIEAMDELLAKDLAFFQNNYAGSLTKRALGYARRFEDVFDVVVFQIAPTVIPLVFVAVVLWSYSPWLIVDPAGNARRDAGSRAAVDPPPPGPGRHPRGRIEHAGRPSRRLDLECGGRPRVRPRAGRGTHPRRERRATTVRRRFGRGTTRTSGSTWSPRRCSWPRTSSGWWPRWRLAAAPAAASKRSSSRSATTRPPRA